MSKQSLAQGTDFARYHDAQHGGSAPLGQAFDTLDPNLRGSAMMNGIDKAITDSALLYDDTLATEQRSADQSGGKRRHKKRRTQKKSKKSKRSQKKSKRSQKKSKRSQQKQQKQQGGSMPPLAPESVNAPGLLLGSKEAYSHAGLNPAYYQGTSTEQWAADMRDRS
jgi:hypothetical protein